MKNSLFCVTIDIHVDTVSNALNYMCINYFVVIADYHTPVRQTPSFQRRTSKTPAFYVPQQSQPTPNTFVNNRYVYMYFPLQSL